MSEVTDVVVPILQRIRADIGELKRKVETMSERLDKIESYVPYSLGLISQNKADIDRQGRSLLDSARRVETLEKTT
jgi:hypothetical protein